MKRLLFISMLCLSLFVSGQQIKFQKIISGEFITQPPFTMNDEGYCIGNTSSGGFILGGSFGKNSTSYGLVIKTDANGDTLWTAIFGSGTNGTVVRTVKETLDKGFIVTGQTQFHAPPLYDAFLSKLDSNGNILWSKVYGGTTGFDEGYDVIETAGQGFLVAGSTFSYSAGGRDIYLIRTDNSGDTLWTRAIGGTGEEYARKIDRTSDNGFIIGGFTDSFGQGLEDALVIKVDQNGNVLWSKTYGTTASDDLGGCVVSNDTIIIAGTSDNDYYLSKISPDGNTVLWTKKYGLEGSDIANDLKKTSNGGFVIAGYNSTGVPDVYLVNLRNNGDTIWTKKYGTETADEGFSVVQAPDGGFGITGLTSYLPSEFVDIYFIKTDINGNSGCHESEAPTNLANISFVAASQTVSVHTGSDLDVPGFLKTFGARPTTECTTVGINDDRSVAKLEIYPNPVLQFLTIEYSNPLNKSYDYEIYSSQGKLFLSGQSSSADYTVVKRGNLKSGLYLIRIKLSGQTVATGKVMID